MLKMDLKTSTLMKADKPTARELTKPDKTGINRQRQTAAQTRVSRAKWDLKNILVPTDYSDASRKALIYAVLLAQKAGSKITLLHVIEPISVYPEAVNPLIVDFHDWLVAAKQALLEEAKKTLRKLRWQEQIGPRWVLKTLIRQGTPHQEITESAHELDADLIIIATLGRTGLAHVLLGSTTERVVRHAPCPVLVVREEERDFLPEAESQTPRVLAKATNPRERERA